MGEINHYTISQTLGSTVRPVDRVRFGHFNLLHDVAQGLRYGYSEADEIHLSYDDDRRIAEAFESVRDGQAPDRLLWDTAFARRFHDACKVLGLSAPPAVLSRRVINIRKNKARYEKHGIVLAPSTAAEVHPSLVAHHAFAIEFALVRIRFKTGASIDDALLDPDLSDEFVALATQISPQLSAQEIRLGALYLRKTRNLSKKEHLLFEALDTREVERDWLTIGNLATDPGGQTPDTPGLIEVLERNHPLYISKNQDLRRTSIELVQSQAFRTIGNHFWTPKPEELVMRIIPGETVHGKSIAHWQLKLIADLKPVLNWPIKAA